MTLRRRAITLSRTDQRRTECSQCEQADNITDPLGFGVCHGEKIADGGESLDSAHPSPAQHCAGYTQ